MYKIQKYFQGLFFFITKSQALVILPTFLKMLFFIIQGKQYMYVLGSYNAMLSVVTVNIFKIKILWDGSRFDIVMFSLIESCNLL